MSRTIRIVFVAFATAIVLVLPAGASVADEPVAGDAPVTTPTTLRELPEGVGDILPRPNSGTAPTSSNERGGWEQLMVFGLLFAAVGIVGLLAWRDMRRKRRRANRTPAPP